MEDDDEAAWREERVLLAVSDDAGPVCEMAMGLDKCFWRKDAWKRLMVAMVREMERQPEATRRVRFVRFVDESAITEG